MLKQFPLATLLIALLGLSSCGLFQKSQSSRNVPTDYNTKSFSAQQAFINYIDQYRNLAMQEQARSGIPASITLAQGLLESGAGHSELAVQANNHFGIKCPGGDWTGPTYFRKDDDKDQFGNIIPSCFRKYNSAQESYLAHTEFLRDPRKVNRYGSLFQLQPTDYENWAVGLSRSGYSTTAGYDNQLIKIIEDYQLHQYDLLAAGTTPTNPNNGTIVNNGGINNGNGTPNYNYPPANNNPTTNNYPPANNNPATNNFPPANNNPTNLQPYNPNYPTGYPANNSNGGYPANNSNGGYPSMNPTANGYTFGMPTEGNNNNVQFVRAIGGLTLEQVAARNDIRLSNLVNYNDGMIDATRPLPEGTILYTQKKRGFSNDTKMYRVQQCETMFDIAQKFGVRLDKLLDRNHLKDGEQPRIGSSISLRRGWFESVPRPALRDTFGEWANCHSYEYNNVTPNNNTTFRPTNPNDGGFDVTPNGSGTTSPSNYPQTQPTTYPSNNTIPSQPNYYPSTEVPSNNSSSYPTTTTYPSSTTTYPSSTTTYPSSTTTYPSSTTTYPSSTTTYPTDNSSSVTYPSSSSTGINTESSTNSYPSYKPLPKPTSPTNVPIQKPSAGVPKPLPIPSSNSYVVKPGETLWRISKQFGTTVERLKAINNLPDNTLKVGQTLRIK